MIKQVGALDKKGDGCLMLRDKGSMSQWEKERLDPLAKRGGGGEP